MKIKQVSLGGVIVTLLVSIGGIIVQTSTEAECQTAATYCTDNRATLDANQILACKIIKRDGCGILGIVPNDIQAVSQDIDSKYVEHRDTLINKRKIQPLSYDEFKNYVRYLNFEINGGIRVDGYNGIGDLEDKIKTRPLEVQNKVSNFATSE